MTTEEKLERFSKAALLDARNQSDALINKTKAALDADFEEYKADVDSQMKERLKAESEKTRQALNKELATKQIEIKRNQGKKQEELKEKIIVEVKDKLANFMGSPEYERYLIKKIKEALSFAGNDEMTVYIDPADETYYSSLKVNTGANIELSKYSFGGGLRAVIRSKNILIDNSFDSKVEEFENSYTFTGGRNDGK